MHVNNVALILNPCIGLVSPQFHFIFDDHFTTVPSLHKRTTLANWKDMHSNKTVHAAHQQSNDSLLFSFDDNVSLINEGDVPDLITEDDVSVGSVPLN